jgi:hypothetical protein
VPKDTAGKYTTEEQKVNHIFFHQSTYCDVEHYRTLPSDRTVLMKMGQIRTFKTASHIKLCSLT